MQTISSCDVLHQVIAWIFTIDRQPISGSFGIKTVCENASDLTMSSAKCRQFRSGLHISSSHFGFHKAVHGKEITLPVEPLTAIHLRTWYICVTLVAECKNIIACPTTVRVYFLIWQGCDYFTINIRTIFNNNPQGQFIAQNIFLRYLEQ